MSYKSFKESVESNYSWLKHTVDSNFQYYVDSALDIMVSWWTGKTYINGQEYIHYTPPILPRPDILKNVFETIYHFKWSDRMDMQPDFDKLKKYYPDVYKKIDKDHSINMNRWIYKDYKKVSLLLHPDKDGVDKTYFTSISPFKDHFSTCQDDTFLCGKKKVEGKETHTLKFLTKKYKVSADIPKKNKEQILEEKQKKEIEEAIKYYNLVVGNIDNMQEKFTEYCDIEEHKSEILCEKTLQKHAKILAEKDVQEGPTKAMDNVELKNQPLVSIQYTDLSDDVISDKSIKDDLNSYSDHTDSQELN
jgi:hypothetical protein